MKSKNNAINCEPKRQGMAKTLVLLLCLFSASVYAAYATPSVMGQPLAPFVIVSPSPLLPGPTKLAVASFVNNESRTSFDTFLPAPTPGEWFYRSGLDEKYAVDEELALENLPSGLRKIIEEIEAENQSSGMMKPSPLPQLKQARATPYASPPTMPIPLAERLAPTLAPLFDEIEAEKERQEAADEFAVEVTEEFFRQKHSEQASGGFVALPKKKAVDPELRKQLQQIRSERRRALKQASSETRNSGRQNALEVNKPQVHEELEVLKPRWIKTVVTAGWGESLEQVEKMIEENGGKVKANLELANSVVAELPDDKVEEVASFFEVGANRKYGGSVLEAIPAVKANLAWANNFTGGGVRIAVLDSGIDEGHPMLAGRVAAKRDFTGSTSGKDMFGHGTHVAGIVAGSNASGVGFNGVAPGALLINAKVLNDAGVGTTQSIAQGLEWALDPDGNPATEDGARVAVMSFGGAYATPDVVLHQAIKNAVEKGVIVVVSSGNCGSACPASYCNGFVGVTTPGDSPDAITVGAVDDFRQWACFSGGGRKNGEIKPDLVAPGVSIASSIPGGYRNSTGTSMSTPFVAGAAALLLQKYRGLPPKTAKAVLEATAIGLGEAGKDEKYGSGFLDVFAATSVDLNKFTNITAKTKARILRNSTAVITVNTSIPIGSMAGRIKTPLQAEEPLAFIKTNDLEWRAQYNNTGQAGSYLATVLAGNVSSSVVFETDNQTIDAPEVIFVNETARIKAKYANFENKTRTLGAWLEILDEVGTTMAATQPEYRSVTAANATEFEWSWQPNKTGFFQAIARFLFETEVPAQEKTVIYAAMPKALATDRVYAPTEVNKSTSTSYTLHSKNTANFSVNASLEVYAILEDKLLKLFSTPEKTILPAGAENLTATGVINLQGGTYPVKAFLVYGDRREATDTLLTVRAPDALSLSNLSLVAQGTFPVNASHCREFQISTLAEERSFNKIVDSIIDARSWPNKPAVGSLWLVNAPCGKSGSIIESEAWNQSASNGRLEKFTLTFNINDTVGWENKNWALYYDAQPNKAPQFKINAFIEDWEDYPAGAFSASPKWLVETGSDSQIMQGSAPHGNKWIFVRTDPNGGYNAASTPDGMLGTLEGYWTASAYSMLNASPEINEVFPSWRTRDSTMNYFAVVDGNLGVLNGSSYVVVQGPMSYGKWFKTDFSWNLTQGKASADLYVDGVLNKSFLQRHASTTDFSKIVACGGDGRLNCHVDLLRITKGRFTPTRGETKIGAETTPQRSSAAVGIEMLSFGGEYLFAATVENTHKQIVATAFKAPAGVNASYCRDYNVTSQGAARAFNKLVDEFVDASAWNNKPSNASVWLVNAPCGNAGSEVESEVWNKSFANGLLEKFTLSYNINDTVAGETKKWSVYYDAQPNKAPQFKINAFIEDWEDYPEGSLPSSNKWSAEAGSGARIIAGSAPHGIKSLYVSIDPNGGYNAVATPDGTVSITEGYWTASSYTAVNSWPRPNSVFPAWRSGAGGTMSYLAAVDSSLGVLDANNFLVIQPSLLPGKYIKTDFAWNMTGGSGTANLYVNGTLKKSNLARSSPASNLSRIVACGGDGGLDCYMDLVRIAKGLYTPDPVATSIGQEQKTEGASVLSGVPLDARITATAVKQGIVVSNFYGEGAAVFAGNKQVLSLPANFSKRSGVMELRIAAEFENNSFEKAFNVTVVERQPPALEEGAASNSFVNSSVFLNATLVETSSVALANFTLSGPSGQFTIPARIVHSGNRSFARAVFYNTTAPGAYFASISACDELGNCASNQIGKFQVIECGSKKVLAVETSGEVASALEGRACVSQWSKSQLGEEPPTDYYSKFDAVFWNEAESPRPITPNTMAALKQYVESGGSVLFAGSAISSSLARAAINATQTEQKALEAFQNITGTVFIGSYASRENESLEVAAFHRISNNLSKTIGLQEGVSDAVQNTTAHSIAVFNSSRTGALTANKFGNGKAVYAAFALAAVKVEQERNKIIKNGYEWLTETPSANVSILDLTPQRYFVFDGNPNNVLVNLNTEGDPANVTIYWNGKLEKTVLAGQAFETSAPSQIGVHEIVVEAIGGGEENYFDNAAKAVVRIAPDAPDIKVNSAMQANKLENQAAVLISLSNNGGKAAQALVKLFVDGVENNGMPQTLEPGTSASISLAFATTPGRHALSVKAFVEGEYNNSDNELNLTAYSCNKQKILIVADDDAQEEAESALKDASELDDVLGADGYCTSFWSERQLGVPSAETLNNYRLVAWSAGNAWNGTLNSSDLQSLEAYNKSLLFFGSDLAFDHANDTRASGILRAGLERDLQIPHGQALQLNFSSDNSTRKVLEGLSGDEINSITVNGTFAPFPDALTPVLNASRQEQVSGAAKYATGGNAIILTKSPSQATAYFSFAIAGLQPSRVKNKLITNTANWLLNNTAS